jgi:hypothetical protein
MDMSDQEIVAKHKQFHTKYGVNPFALLDIAGRYASTLQADNEMLGPAMALYNDIVGLQVKYKALIDRFQANLPQNQKMITEALPLLGG